MSAAVATRMISAEKRQRIVELAKDGLPYETIAKDEQVKLGSRQAVAYHLKAWFAETRPDPEATEELRQMQWVRLEDLVATLRPRVMGPLMGMFGPVKGEDGEFIIVPQAAIIDRLMKVYDRQARLMGLDLERNVQVNILPTAEAMASAFGWAGDSEPEAIEGTAVELEPGDAT